MRTIWGLLQDPLANFRPLEREYEEEESFYSETVSNPTDLEEDSNASFSSLSTDHDEGSEAVEEEIEVLGPEEGERTPAWATVLEAAPTFATPLVPDPTARPEGVPEGIASRTRRRQAALEAEKTAAAIRHLRDQAKTNGRQLLRSGEFLQTYDPTLFYEPQCRAWTGPSATPIEPGSPPKRRRKTKGPAVPSRPASEGGRGVGGTRPYHECHLLRGRQLTGARTQPMLAQHAAERYLPNSQGSTVLRYSSRPYSGQFSKDGKFFYVCSQDFCVRLYDATDPYHLHEYKSIKAQVGQWTITDGTLSSDNRLLAYSSISPIVHVARTDEQAEQFTVDLSFHRLRRESRGFGIWSLRFSADNHEIVAGTSSNAIYVYDLEKQSVVLAMQGHSDDVNAVCFGDESKNLLYSGSGDSLIKVWDRRSLGTSAKPVGVLPGHTEDITYVSARGDGRYAVSNGKDQTAKLWDVRKMVEPHVFDGWPSHVRDRRLDWDYRYQTYPLGPLGPAKYRHPKDASIVTMTGHSVLVTLIRVHFDPVFGTHVVTGSRDGIVRIYNLLGECVRELDTHLGRSTDGHFSDDEIELGFLHGWRRELVVRDVAWHPSMPLLLSTSWSGEGGGIVRHDYEKPGMGY